ncbi:MAG TPA: hypothetical protein VH087_21000 [Thermoanaerobaculia bacterium]|nr:hypothetical protein [Thermoanaerobaculia bacterium]
MRSIRSSSRDRTSERGFALAAAIFLAVLYFMLIELLLIDGTRALKEAQRFRSRIVALTLAESAAELAAAQMVNTTNAHVDVDSTDGMLTGQYTRSGDSFQLFGDATTKGVAVQKAHVTIQGRIVNGTQVVIDYTNHSQ